MTKVQSIKTATPATPKRKADDTLISIAEAVLAFRGEQRPNLATVARIINRASALARAFNAAWRGRPARARCRGSVATHLRRRSRLS
jgi:hypothetical protein